jgi:hypothetical protein
MVSVGQKISTIKEQNKYQGFSSGGEITNARTMKNMFGYEFC